MALAVDTTSGATVLMIHRAKRWSVRVAVLVLAALSLAAAPHPAASPIEGARLMSAQPLQGQLYHVQGLELAANRIWVTSVDLKAHKGYLHEFDRATGHMLRRMELTDGARYHAGGISLSGGSIWVPVAEPRPNSTAILLQIDANSLQVRRRLFVTDHVGCVAASGQNLVAGNWNSDRIYVIDLRHGGPVRVVPNPSATHYQDMKFVDAQLVAGGTRSLWSGTVDWIDWPSMTIRKTLRSGAIGPVRPFGRGGPYTGEGMAIDGRDLYVIPEDGPSRLFHFQLDA